MANGLVVADTAISVGGRAVLGASLGRVQGFQYTESSDLTLTAFGSVADADRIGDASQTIVIPTEGFLTLNFTGRILLDGSVAGATETNFMLGVRIGTTNYWGTIDDNGGATTYYALRLGAYDSASDYLEWTGWGGGDSGGFRVPDHVNLDIQALSIPTGSRSVGFVVGVVAAGSILKGGTTASRGYLTVTDCT